MTDQNQDSGFGLVILLGVAVLVVVTLVALMFVGG